jgi:hypothetical protein
MADSRADDPETAATDDAASSGPRHARDLEARPRSGRLLFGVVFLILGAIVIGLAIANFSSDDEDARSDKKTSQDAGGKDEAASDSAGGKETGKNSTATEGGAAVADKARWPSVTAGRPREFGKLDDAPPADSGKLQDGFYLWQDFDGWHLWVVGGTPEDRVTITSDAEIAKAVPTGGDVAIERTPNALTFSRGGATGRVVGVDFNPGYYARTIIATTEGGLRLHAGFGHRAVPNAFGMSFSTASN